MIIIPKLSSGLGNRLFQYACAQGVAEKWKGNVIFLLSQCGSTDHGSFNNIFKMFPSIPVETAPPHVNKWSYFHEGDGAAFTYEEFPEVPNLELAIITGCRQSELYFPKSRIEPSWSSLGYESLLESYNLNTDEKQKNTWWLHVRLGDYRKLSHHYIDLRSYYLKAFLLLKKGSRILWASDEPDIYGEYLKNIAAECGHELILIKETDELKTLYLLSHCKAGGIGSNSTYSWWAAYFSGGGKSEGTWYFPEIWGNEMYGLPKSRDIYSGWMTKLSV